MLAGVAAAGSTTTGCDSLPDLQVPPVPYLDAQAEDQSIVSGAASPPDFRIVNYLGSKLRLLGPIKSAVGRVAPPGGAVCDLFAGSGAVSVALATDWTVTAADIQEYSRVLCSALLNPVSDTGRSQSELLTRASCSQLGRSLREALSDLVAYERACLRSSEAGDMEGLCDLMEHGSLLSAAAGGTASSERLGILMEDALARLRHRHLDEGAETVVTRHFGGTYFSWEQAIELDVLLAEVHAMDALSRDYFLAAVLAVASDAVNTIGKHFAQPVRPRSGDGRPKRHLVRKTVRDRSVDVIDAYRGWLHRLASLPRSSVRHESLRGDFRDVLADSRLRFDAVYADPPYTRDHYSRFYHVLETMCLHDEPDVSTTMIRADGEAKQSRGSYRADRHQSPFCIKSQAPGAFDDLCRGVRARSIPLVLSYSPFKAAAGNRPRLLTVDQLLDITRRHFAHVALETVGGVAHNKFNLASRNVDVDYDAEVLFICTP